MPVISVTGPDGRAYLVDSQYLKDPNEPKTNLTIGVTTDNQMFQVVDGAWYRLLRTDRVDYNTIIAPVGKQAIAWAFPIGRAAGYTD